MTSIGLISDTHSFLDETVFEHFKNCDEIWHSGDFGNISIANKLQNFKPFKGVYGNIDTLNIRKKYPEQLVFNCENVKVMMRHIGGNMPRYNVKTKNELLLHKPQLLITGHTHILKIYYNENMECLHINAGAAGLEGRHKKRTIIRFKIDGSNMLDCEVIEL